MKCTNCGGEMQEGAKFCPGCGTAVVSQEIVKKISLKCEQCGGTLAIDSDKTALACPYCGHKSLIIENDAVTIERIKTEAHKEIELEKIKSEDRRLQQVEEKEQKKETKSQVEKFRKGKWSKFLLIAFLLAAVLTYFFFSSGRIFAGILSLIQVGCFGVAWCMGMNIIKEKRRYIHVLIAIFGIILIIPTVRSCGSLDSSENVETIKWSIIYMGDIIPEPNSKKIEIHDNQEDVLWIDVHNTTETEYFEYIAASKALGYTVSVNENSIGYDAYNEDGYYLDISYYESGKEMSVRLEAPVEMSDLIWSEHKVSSVLPEPKTTIGAFVVETDEANTIVLGDTEKTDFTEYCEACKQAGFEIDAKNEDDAYTAFDENGNKVRITYNSRNKELTINFEYPMLFTKITWPTVGVGTLAPVPKSLSGKVGNDFGWTYSVYIENISREDYEAYVQECIDAGFNKDVRNYGDSVWGNYSDDININVAYKGFNTMYVSVTGSVSDDYSSYTRKPGKDEIIESNNVDNKDYAVDFKDAAEFEAALNNGEKVEGKTVQFSVIEYKPNSAMGINCWAGEHLNFISENEVSVENGDIVVGRVTKEASNVFGSWKIPYELIVINPDGKETELTTTPKPTATPKPTVTPKPTATPMPSSEYEKAYIREMSNYTLYLMFDEDTKKAVAFGTNDTYVMKGKYSGGFASGVTISWNDGWDETLKHSGGSKATLIDGNGFDWSYEVCDVMRAQTVLDGLK